MRYLVLLFLLFAIPAQAEILNLLIEVPETLDVLKQAPVIDPNTGLQATEPGTDKIDFTTCSSFPDITDPDTGEVMDGGIDISTCSVIPLSGVLIWGDYLIGNGAVYELSRMSAEWPPTIMPGTHAVTGSKLIMAKVEDGDSTDPLAMIEALFEVYSLPWTVAGLQDFYDSPGYCSDTQYTDEQNCTENIEVWTAPAPKTYRKITMDTYSKYQNDRKDQVNDCSWWARWAGASVWICE